MEPLFEATSGNCVLHITDLGPDGRHVAWELKPTEQDCDEFERYIGDNMSWHNGGRRP